MPGPNFKKMYRRFKRKKTFKAKPRKKIDKQQTKQIKTLQKQVKKLTDVIEPQRIKMPFVKHDINGCHEADQLRLTKSTYFQQKPIEVATDNDGHFVATSIIPESQYRQGDQLTIGNLTCHLTLWDINNSFRWRVLIVQYKERTDLARVEGDANNYNTNLELDNMLRWHNAPTNLSNLERLNYNLISPLKLKKNMRDSCHILYDKIYTGKNRTLNQPQLDNQILTKKFIIKPKIRKLQFKEKNHSTPYRGDICCYIWNDYPFSGSRKNGYLGLDQTNHTEKKKGYSFFCEYNIYDQ